MSGINKVILIGHLGKDPEMRYLEGGVSVTSFPLATSESFNNFKIIFLPEGSDLSNIG